MLHMMGEDVAHSTPSLLQVLLTADVAGNCNQNRTEGFVQTHGLGICRGCYAKALIKEWRRWDKLHTSENDPVDAFPSDQLYVVFVVANGGADLEHFELRSFTEAQSILLQVYSHCVN